MIGEERWGHNLDIFWRQNIVGWAKRCRFLVQQIRIGRIVPGSGIQAIDERVESGHLLSGSEGAVTGAVDKNLTQQIGVALCLDGTRVCLLSLDHR